MRYSLRALLLLVLLAALPMAWMAKVQREYAAERQAIKELVSLGFVAEPEGLDMEGIRWFGVIEMAPTSPHVLPWLSPTFDPSRQANFKKILRAMTEADVRWDTIPDNWRARHVSVYDGWLFSPGDKIIPHLAQLRHLESIEILGTDITEDGIRELRRALPKCEIDWDPDYGRIAENE